MSSIEGIPIRRLVVHDPKDLPLHYGETPGGSIFSTTPGGSRIYYDRAFLLSRRDSPMTRSPPKLPYIPEVTLIPEPETSDNILVNGVKTDKERSNSSVDKSNSSASEQQQSTTPKSAKKEGDDQFSMDM